MKEIDILKQIFGPSTDNLITLILVLYFAAIGFFKLLEIFNRILSDKTSLKREKDLLEVVKLKCEIEVLKKQHGLTGTGLDTEKDLQFSPLAVRATAEKPLSVRFAQALARHGIGGKAVIFMICLFLLTIGFVYILDIPLLIRLIIIGEMGFIEAISPVTLSVLLGSITIFYGWYRYGSVLIEHSKLGNLAVKTFAFGLAITIEIIAMIRNA